jgi:hypothetical protein
MADTDIDAVRKQKKAEYNKKKRIPSIFKDEISDHVYVLGHSYT